MGEIRTMKTSCGLSSPVKQHANHQFTGNNGVGQAIKRLRALTVFNSHHHNMTKSGVIQCLATRAEKICHPTRLHQKRQHMRAIFHTDDWPLPQETPQTPSARSTGAAEPPPSHVKGVSERIERMCRYLGIKITFKYRGTLRKALVHTKQPQPALKKGVVYQVPCADCDCV